jgi:L-seryl-tRNA(Ser) seleniumtransferase
METETIEDGRGGTDARGESVDRGRGAMGAGKGTGGKERVAALRALPAVERLAAALSEAPGDPAASSPASSEAPEAPPGSAAASRIPHHIAVAAAREELGRARAAIRAGAPAPDPAELAAAAAERAALLAAPSLRPVINATGVVLHTNLGRAPLPAAAVERVAAVAAGYSNLEYDLEGGRRGSRAAHLDSLLRELGGAEAALAVNNNAAAVMLALAALAGDGEVLVSRGQLVEIGGSFRIPDILAQSGATLVEVGTTNRTRLTDYEAAVTDRTTAILRVHQSNFRIVGFTEEPEAAALAGLARERGLAMVDDLGSGALAEVLGEPTVRAAVAAGADVVCCSGDKLLGGPQAGILLGRAAAIERCRTHPLARALRLDKLQIAALEATLRVHRDGGAAAVPALAMIAAPEEELRARAERMVAAIAGASVEATTTGGEELRVRAGRMDAPIAGASAGEPPAGGEPPLGASGQVASLDRESGAPGGGSLADVALEGPVCAVEPGTIGADTLLARLREADPPVIARIVKGRVVLDPRTMSDAEAEQAAAAVRAALERP